MALESRSNRLILLRSRRGPDAEVSRVISYFSTTARRGRGGKGDQGRIFYILLGVRRQGEVPDAISRSSFLGQTGNLCPAENMYIRMDARAYMDVVSLTCPVISRFSFVLTLPASKAATSRRVLTPPSEDRPRHMLHEGQRKSA